MKQRTWADWEKRPPQALLYLRKLAERYHTSTDYLLGLTDDPRAVREVSPEELAAMLDDAPEPAPEIQALLRFAARLDEEGLYTLLTVAEALAGREDGPSPAEIARGMKERGKEDEVPKEREKEQGVNQDRLRYTRR